MSKPRQRIRYWCGFYREKPGVQTGDIILEFDGKPVHDVSELPRLVAGTIVGKSVNIKLLREGKHLDKTVTVEKLKGDPADSSSQVKLSQDLGISVQEISREYAESMNIPYEKGIVITAVTGVVVGAGTAGGNLFAATLIFR